MSTRTLEERITHLEDLDAIKQLKARYCEICDDDHNFSEITTIFAEDGIWEGKGIGKASGHQEIVELFKSFQTAISFSQHMVQNPIIEIDGNRARGRWYFSACSLCTMVMRDVGRLLVIMNNMSNKMKCGK